MSVQRWEFIKERFKEKKENTLSTKRKSKIQEKKKENTLSINKENKENTLTNKKKVRKQDLDHAIDQEKSNF